MAKPKGKGPGKHRKGLVKGAIAKVGVDEKSKARLKRNPRKAKAKCRKGKVSPANQGKGKKGRESKVDQDGVTKEEGKVAAGEKRKDGSGGQGGSKRQKVSDQRKPHVSTPLSRKERRHLKRKKRKNFDLISQTLHLWERLRKHNLQETERSQLLKQTMELIAGHIREFALKHDTARVIQCCLKYGTPHQQTAIFNELKDHVVELSKSTYAKFIVKTLMRLCPVEQRNQLITGLYGHVRTLVRHKEAVEIVEYAYNEHATAKQRSALLQEFYGRKFALFKTPEAVGLEEVLAAIDGVQERESVMRHMMESLTKLLDKAVVKHSIVHKVLLDFLLHCNEASRAEMIEQLHELVVEMVHTKEGSRVALHTLWHGTPKDRKVIVKSFKPYVKKICMEEYGHVVMMGVFDSVDDTVLVKKNLLSELTPCLGELCAHQYGRRVLLYLLSPRNRQHFSSQFIQNVLAHGDGNKHTKKSPTVRYRELLEGLAPPLLSLATERVGEWVVDKPHAPLLLQIVASLPGDITPLYKPLIEMLQMTFDPDNHIVTHPCGHWVVKRLLGGRQKKMEEKDVEEREEEEKGLGEKEREEENERGSLFAAMILDRVEADSIRSWTSSNRGAFVVCSLLKSGGAGVRERLQNILDPLSVCLQSGQLQGQQALWRELTTCTTGNTDTN